jgi:hypothetical protein
MPSIDELLADERTKGLVRQYLGADAFGTPDVALEDTATPSAFAGVDAHAEEPFTHASPAPTIGDRARSFLSGVKGIPEATLNRQAMGLDADTRQILEAARVPTVRRVEPLPAGRAAAPAKAGKSADPHSPESKAAQDRVRSVLGGQMTDDEIAHVTAESEERVLKYGTLARGDEIRREGHVESAQRSKADREQRAKQFSESMGFRWADMDQEERLAWARINEAREARETAATTRAGERVEDQASSYAAKYAESGLPEFYTLHGKAAALFEKYPKSLPGVGIAAGRVPRRFSSNDANTLRSVFGQMMLAYKQSVTGLGSSAKEDDAIREATGLVQTGDDDSLKLGVQILKDVMDAKGAALKATAPPAAVDLVGSRLPPPTAPEKATPTKSTPKDASNQPTSAPEAPARLPVKRTPSKDRKWMRIDYSDGTSETVPNG